MNALNEHRDTEFITIRVISQTEHKMDSGHTCAFRRQLKSQLASSPFYYSLTLLRALTVLMHHCSYFVYVNGALQVPILIIS